MVLEKIDLQINFLIVKRVSVKQKGKCLRHFPFCLTLQEKREPIRIIASQFLRCKPNLATLIQPRYLCRKPS